MIRRIGILIIRLILLPLLLPLVIVKTIIEKSNTKVKDILLLSILSIFTVGAWAYGFLYLGMKWEFITSFVFFGVMVILNKYRSTLKDLRENIDKLQADIQRRHDDIERRRKMLS